MKFDIPHEYLQIYKTLKQAGFEVFFVGGCVRNLFMGRDVKDWDLTTNAIPQQILEVFSNGFYDNKFGTVGIPIGKENKKDVVEITTFRSESEYKDNRHPEKIEWGRTIEEDLKRRDFTMNAIALKVNGKNTFIDPYNGESDIKDKLIRSVGEADERFTEDALRLLRAVRFAAQLGFSIEEKTWKSVSKNAGLIKNISAERIRDELMKVMGSENPYEGVMLLINSGLMKFILPELMLGAGVSQERPGRHHTEDVLTHNLLALKFCPSSDPIVRFATLIHDIGKPKVEGKDSQGLVIFYNHEVAGAQMALDICERLKFSKKEKDRIFNLVRWHMFSVDEKITDGAIRRFIRRAGVENVTDIIDLRIGDRLGSGTRDAESWRLKSFKERVQKELSPKPFSMEDMAIDGNDIMKDLSMKPGPKVGEILQKLFEEVDEDLSKNTKEYLQKRIKELN